MSRIWSFAMLLCGLLFLPIRAQTVNHPLHAAGAGVLPPKLVWESVPIFPHSDSSAHPLNCGQAYLIIDTAGAVFEVKLTKSTGDEATDAAFLAAIRQDRFKAAMKDGQLVAVDMYMDLCMSTF